MDIKSFQRRSSDSIVSQFISLNEEWKESLHLKMGLKIIDCIFFSAVNTWQMSSCIQPLFNESEIYSLTSQARNSTCEWLGNGEWKKLKEHDYSCSHSKQCYAGPEVAVFCCAIKKTTLWQFRKFWFKLILFSNFSLSFLKDMLRATGQNNTYLLFLL